MRYCARLKRREGEILMYGFFVAAAAVVVVCLQLSTHVTLLHLFKAREIGAANDREYFCPGGTQFNW